jgi:hypothetical protein
MLYHNHFIISRNLQLFVSKVFQARSQLRHSVCLSNRPSVCRSAWNNPAPTKSIFMKFEICEFFENLSRKFKFH